MTQPKQINIMHVVDKLSMDGTNPSSCTILLKDWIASSDPDKFSFSVCSFRNPDPAGRLLEKEGIEVHYLGFGKFSLRNVREICTLIQKNKIDLVHLHGYGASNFGRIAARKMGIVNVVHEHAVLRIIPYQYVADFLLRNRTDMAVAVSESVKAFMRRGRCLPTDKIRVIGNGIRLADFRKRSKTENHKKRLALRIPEHAQIVGTVTRLRREKGNAVFIEAMPEIIAKCPNVFFLVVGDGPLRQSLEDLCKDLKIDAHVQFLGFRSDIAELLSLFEINVIPSLMEGFSLSLVEAMAVGNAIVATKVGGMRDIGEEGKNCLFVEPGSAKQLSEKIIFLLNHPNEASNLAREAEHQSHQYGIKSSADALTQLYADLLPVKCNEYWH